MSRIRSPGYPSCSLEQAIDLTKRIHIKVRRNAIDREAAVKEAGYSGMTGASAKMLSNLAHFGLIEKSSKGDIRVSELAVKILHPRSDAEKRDALIEAAYNPELFAGIREANPDGFVSEIALKNLLQRDGFAKAAIGPAVKSYLETYSYLREAGVTESHSEPSSRDAELMGRNAEMMIGVPREQDRISGQMPPPARTGVSLMDGERELTTGLLSKGSGFRLIVNGPIGVREIERLIKKLELDKEILADGENDELF